MNKAKNLPKGEKTDKPHERKRPSTELKVTAGKRRRKGSQRIQWEISSHAPSILDTAGPSQHRVINALIEKGVQAADRKRRVATQKLLEWALKLAG